MRIFILSLLLVLLTGGVQAAPPICGPTKVIMDKVTSTKPGGLAAKQYGQAVYREDGSWRLLFANLGWRLRPSAWTIVEVRSHNRACILSVGNSLPEWLVDLGLNRDRA